LSPATCAKPGLDPQHPTCTSIRRTPAGRHLAFGSKTRTPLCRRTSGPRERPLVKLSHSALGYFGTRLAQTRRSLHSLADPSLVSGEPKASHMAGIKEWRNQNPRRRQPWRFAAPCTDSAPARSLSRRHWRPSSAKRANTVRIATQISSSRMEVHLAILVARASPREGCGAVRRALLCCGCHRVGARVATCNSRRVKKLVPKSSSLLRRENSLFFENNSLLWLQKFPVRLRREFVRKPLNQMND
jgi:hypothetical protein